MAALSDQDQLLLLVQQAASADAGTRQSAEVTLCQREFTPGYMPFVLVAQSTLCTL